MLLRHSGSIEQNAFILCNIRYLLNCTRITAVLLLYQDFISISFFQFCWCFLGFSEDSNEVPNQCGSSIIGTVDNTASQSTVCSATVPVASSAEALHPQQQQHSEATSSGSVAQPEVGNISSVVMSQASPSVPSSSARGRHVSPHCRQQQHLVLVSERHNNEQRK